MSAANLVERSKQRVHKDMITSLDVPYTGNSDFLYSSSRDKKIYQWELDKSLGDEQIGKLKKEFMGQKHHINGVKSNKTNNMIVSVSSDKSARIYNLKNQEFIELKAQKKDLTGVSINSDDNKIITSSYDGTLALWNTRGELSKILELNENQNSFPIWTLCCGFIPNSNSAVTGSSDGKLRIWDLEKGEISATFSNGHLTNYYTQNELPIPDTYMITALAISADGSFCAYGGRDTQCYIISFLDNSQVLSFDAEAPINSLAFSITEPIIAVATRDSIICWNVLSNEMVLQQTNEKKTQYCTSLIWSRNSLVTGWNDGEIKIFDFVRAAEQQNQ